MQDCYKTIGKHMFIAYPLYAETIASEHWCGRKLLVRRVRQLENPQVYE